MVAFALAMMTASPVTRAISSGVTTGEDAKPHAPFTMTRTPKPKLESSVTLGTASVFPVPRSGERRRPSRWSSRRTMRISQYVALDFLASRNATSPSFSSSGEGVLESLGAAKRFEAKAAEVARKCLRVSIPVIVSRFGRPLCSRVRPSVNTSLPGHVAANLSRAGPSGPRDIAKRRGGRTDIADIQDRMVQNVESLEIDPHLETFRNVEVFVQTHIHLKCCLAVKIIDSAVFARRR